uniref:Integrator complex subunit 3 isogeny n=1 Tax=Cajanus cajan TaxID=3821 RepID=A0A151T0T8_CAJCA|nr:Integrator complex subunit 3 isogeny [Cajanus cajan]
MALRLTLTPPFEAEKELEASLRKAFESLKPSLRPPFSLTIPTPHQYALFNAAILHALLTEPHIAKTHIKHLHATVTDGYATFCTLLHDVVHHLYPTLLAPVKTHLLYLTHEIVRVLGIGYDAVLVSLLRQIAAADFGDGNLWLCSKTSSRYSLLRISPEMETQLRFLLTNVKLGHQRRHQIWFARKFLSEPDREFVIVDIVRFICCAHHPTNEIIQSDIVPRWALIGWLLTCCRRSHVVANVKLALFYDWLFFDESVDNIMNIEPAVLLMVHSIPQYIEITRGLLEFLLHLVDNYDVERKGMIVKGVASAFQLLVRKGVIRSLDVLTSCPALSPGLREGLVRLSSGAKVGSS